MAATATAPIDPATWLAAPGKEVGEGAPVIMGFVPLPAPEMLLTSKDGHGVPSDMDGAVRVIILSGDADGHEVPQGARTVDCMRISTSLRCPAFLNIPGRLRRQPQRQVPQEKPSW